MLAVGGAQVAVDFDAAPVEIYSCRLEPDPLDVGATARRDQHMGAVDRFLHGFAGPRDDAHAAAARLDTQNLDVFAQDNAFRRQLGEENFGEFRIFVGEGVARFQDRHLAAEPPYGLGKCQSILGRTDDDQPARQSFEVEERVGR